MSFISNLSSVINEKINDETSHRKNVSQKYGTDR